MDVADHSFGCCPFGGEDTQERPLGVPGKVDQAGLYRRALVGPALR